MSEFIVSLFSLTNLFWNFAGVFIGIVFGAIPGLTATLGIALFLWFFAIFAIVAYLNSFLFRQAFKRLALGPG